MLKLQNKAKDYAFSNVHTKSRWNHYLKYHWQWLLSSTCIAIITNFGNSNLYSRELNFNSAEMKLPREMYFKVHVSTCIYYFIDLIDINFATWRLFSYQLEQQESLARKFEIYTQQCNIWTKIDNLNYRILKRIWNYVYRFNILLMVWHINIMLYSQCLLSQFSRMDERGTDQFPRCAASPLKSVCSSTQLLGQNLLYKLWASLYILEHNKHTM